MTRLLSRGRQDDNEQTIRRRLQVYREQTEPLIEFYRNREQLVAVDGDRAMELVTAELQTSSLWRLLNPRNTACYSPAFAKIC